MRPQLAQMNQERPLRWSQQIDDDHRTQTSGLDHLLPSFTAQPNQILARQPSPSSSSSSSFHPANINVSFVEIDPNFSTGPSSHYYSSTNQQALNSSRIGHNTRRPRKQHTLNSIGRVESRSRSPIVGVSDQASRPLTSEPTQASLIGICFLPEANQLDDQVQLKKQQKTQKQPSLDPMDSSNGFDAMEQSRAQNFEQQMVAGGRFSKVDPGVSTIVATNLDESTLINSSLSESQLFNRNLESGFGGGASERANGAKGDKPVFKGGPLSSLSSASSWSSSSASSADDQEDDHEDSKASRRPSERRAAKNSAELELNEAACGFEVVWLNFSYSVHPNIFEDPRWGKINKILHKERRTILKNLSGGVRSGQMVALMGPSGAGKTCLLECIAGLRTDGIEGKMLVRGRKSAQLVIVPQYDDFLPQFTVEEIICFGSKMKNSANSDHKAITNTVIEQLGLQGCRKNNIQKCSGGQRKRVAIAQELVSKPNILILDEPTSGLDSSCCYQTMRVLKDILEKSVYTKQPMAIVTTIHQPSAKVFKMFDFVYLLGKTGHPAYSGPPDELLPTIKEITGLECPRYSNPSDYMMELVSYDYGERPAERLIEHEKEKAKQFVRDFKLRSKDTTIEKSSLYTNNHLSVVGSASEGEVKGNSCYHLNNKDDTIEARKFKTNQITMEHVNYSNNVIVPLRRATIKGKAKHPFFWHMLVHIHRSYLQAIRDPILHHVRILIHIVFAVLLVVLFGEKGGATRGCPPVLGLPNEITDPNNESLIDLADNVGFLFMSIMMITYVSLMSTVLTFPVDIKTVGKEYKNGWYGTLSYFLGKSLADLPFIIIYPVLYCAIVWYFTNQPQDGVWRFLSFTGLIILNAMNSQSFGLILGAVFVNSVSSATLLGPVISIPWFLFTGFTKKIHNLAGPYITTSNFLFTRYVFEGLLSTVYGYDRCNCSEFLQNYYELRYEEAVRLGQMISAETLSSLDYYDGIDTIADVQSNRSMGGNWLEKTVDVASTMFANGEELNLANLIETNGKASSLFSFGLDFEPICPTNYQSYIIVDFRLGNDALLRGFVATTISFLVARVITYIVVAWKIRTREL